MKHRWLLLVIPLALCLTTVTQAGLRCGGCSDPCGRSAGVFHRGGRDCGLLGRYGLFNGSGMFGHRRTADTYGYSATSSGVAPANSPSVVSYAQNYVGQNCVTPTYPVPSVAVSSAIMSPTVISSSTMPMGEVIGGSGFGGVAIDGSFVAPQTQALCEPIQTYKTVMESQIVNETRYVCTTEYRTETRYRTRTVYKTVPVEVQDYRSRTVMVPKTETKTVEYTVLIPEQSEKTIEVQNSVPVWKEVSETYTVKVPEVIDVPEEYTVRVPQLGQEEFSYTIFVPHAETVTKYQTVTNAIPVVKTRKVLRCVPTTTTKSVTKDYGHWETVVEPAGVSGAVVMPSVSTNCATPVTNNVVSMGGCGSSMTVGCGSGCGTYGSTVATSGCSPCGGSSGCGATVASPSVGCNSGCNSAYAYSQPMSSGCGCDSTVGAVATAAPATVSRRVWVPNVVTEQVPVVESKQVSEEVAYTVYEQQTQSVPFECAYLVYRPETRTGTRQIVNYTDETRTRNRKKVEYRDEERTRTRRELSYKMETKTESYPVINYRTEKRTKEVSFTVNVPEVKLEPFTKTTYERVPEDLVEEYTVQIPVPAMKEVQVQVCRMVPRLVPVTINPCAVSSSTSTGPSVIGSTVAPAPMVSSGVIMSGTSDCGGCGSSGYSTAPAVMGTGSVMGYGAVVPYNSGYSQTADCGCGG